MAKRRFAMLLVCLSLMAPVRAAEWDWLATTGGAVMGAGVGLEGMLLFEMATAASATTPLGWALFASLALHGAVIGSSWLSDNGVATDGAGQMIVNNGTALKVTLTSPAQSTVEPVSRSEYLPRPAGMASQPRVSLTYQPTAGAIQQSNQSMYMATPGDVAKWQEAMTPSVVSYVGASSSVDPVGRVYYSDAVRENYARTKGAAIGGGVTVLSFSDPFPTTLSQQLPRHVFMPSQFLTRIAGGDWDGMWKGLYVRLNAAGDVVVFANPAEYSTTRRMIAIKLNQDTGESTFYVATAGKVIGYGETASQAIMVAAARTLDATGTPYGGTLYAASQNAFEVDSAGNQTGLKENATLATADGSAVWTGGSVVYGQTSTDVGGGGGSGDCASYGCAKDSTIQAFQAAVVEGVEVGDPVAASDSEMTAAMPWLGDLFNPLRTWSPQFSGTCPAFAVELLGHQYSSTVHCDLWAENEAQWRAMMIVVWGLVALRIVLSA